MIFIEKDWCQLEEGLQRALRERDTLVAQALAAAPPGGELVSRLDVLEGQAQAPLRDSA